MPYKSDAQRKFLHARKPKIAAKWDAEAKMSKSMKGHRGALVGFGVAAGGGALANQIPPVQDVYEKRKRKRKRDVSKSLEPVWIRKSDSYFNDQVAQKVFELVSKMDDDTAEMFAYFTVCEMLDADISKNRRVLQRHLDEVVAKRMEKVKKAVIAVAARDGVDEETLAYADAISKAERPKTPYEHGYTFQESKIRRNQSGQFTTKVKVNPNAKPWRDAQLKAMGHKKVIDHQEKLNEAKGRKLGPQTKSQLQQEYMQLHDFLQAFQDKGGDAGDTVMVHVENKTTGERYSVPSATGTSVPLGAWDPRTERVVGMEARPSQLKMAGATYNLGQALGASGETSGQMAFHGQRIDQNMPVFAQEWTQPTQGDYLNTNARTYGRVATGAQFVGATARPGSAVHTAARLAQFAGEHGPEAEKVFGPAARKSAYRYRGTEKTPDKHIVTLYDRAVTGAKVAAPVPGNRAEPSVGEMATHRAKAKDRAPTWDERDPGRQVIMAQLGFNVPNRQLYGLQLAAGNTPPSEGILLNRNGQIVTQAVGYGDDHYLPFNLKNLKALKGGEYIRTRSVGGPTSEDIYTGLLTGARQVTVISRSGTFTVKFDETLRGGRRYNDKAMRMTDRYEHLLDAVESEQVDAKPVPDHVRERIQSEIERDYGDWSPNEQKRMYRNKEEEYKAFGTGLTKEDKNYIDSRVQLEMDRDPTADHRQIKRDLTAQAMAEKEFKFRLNGEGYKSALQALQEQFPYYIKVDAQPRRDINIPESEKDKGYVMPRHNQPAAALHGYFNPRIAGEGQVEYKGEKAGKKTGKVQASEANYQNLAYAQQAVRSPSAPKTEETASFGGSTESPTGGRGEDGGAPTNMGGSEAERKSRVIKEKIRETKDEDELATTAWSLIKATPRKEAYNATNPLAAMVTNEDHAGFMKRVRTPEGRSELTRMIADAPPASYKARKEYIAYAKANSKVDRKNYTDLNALDWPDKPYKFPDEVHRKTADPKLVENRLTALNAHALPVSSNKNYVEMSDQEKEEELNKLRYLAMNREDFKGSASEQRALFGELGVGNPGNAGKLVNDKDPKAITKQAKRLHEIRLLQHNQDAKAVDAAHDLLGRLREPGTEPVERPDYSPRGASENARQNIEQEAGGVVTNVGTKAPSVSRERLERLESTVMDLYMKKDKVGPDQAAQIDTHIKAMEKVLKKINLPNQKGQPLARVHPDDLDQLEAGADALLGNHEDLM